MPEILTESFCERCGTRYTFESVAPRKTRRLGQFKTLSKGVRNWVMSDDSSLDEALAAARSDEERAVTAQQLDAFHAAFNFCMNCRQYTCANCWNPVEGRCLTCAPNLGAEVLPAPFPDTAGFEPIRMDAEAWPEIDLAGAASSGAAGLDVAGMPAGSGNGFHDAELVESPNDPGEPLPDVDAMARLAFLAGETRDEPAAPEIPDATAVESASPAWADGPLLEPELGAAPDDDVAPAESATAHDVDLMPAAAADGDLATDEPTDGTTPEPAALESTPEDTDQRAAELASRTSVLLGRFRPGQNLDAEIAAYEARLEAEEALLVEEPATAAAADAPAEPLDDGAPEPATGVDGWAVLEPVAEVEPAATAELEPAASAAEPDAEPVGTEGATAAQPAAAFTAGLPETESPVAEPQPESAAGASEGTPDTARDDLIEQPTWRIFAPDQTALPHAEVPGTGAPVGTPVQASGDPQWPARPELEESPSMALFANRDRVSSDALWAASAREVLGGPVGPAPAPTAGIQPCSNCGLSLSANARFCRRCGTRQA